MDGQQGSGVPCAEWEEMAVLVTAGFQVLKGM